MSLPMAVAGGKKLKMMLFFRTKKADVIISDTYLFIFLVEIVYFSVFFDFYPFIIFYRFFNRIYTEVAMKFNRRIKTIAHGAIKKNTKQKFIYICYQWFTLQSHVALNGRKSSKWKKLLVVFIEIKRSFSPL